MTIRAYEEIYVSKAQSVLGMRIKKQLDKAIQLFFEVSNQRLVPLSERIFYRFL